MKRGRTATAARLRLRGLRAGNLQDFDLDLPLGAWTAIHGPSGAGKSALLFGVLEPVARRRFRVLADPRALPDGDESWLAGAAREIGGLTPVIAGAGEIPRARRAVLLGSAWGLWSLLDRAWQRSGEHACTACGARWAPWNPAAVVAGCSDLPDETPLLVFSAAGGEAAHGLQRAGWTRVRLGADSALARLEEAPETLPHSAWLLLDRLRWSPAREQRLREALELALRRGGAARVEAAGAVRELPAARSCPSCGALRPADPSGAPGPVHAGRWLLDRSWEAWACAPLEDWRSWSAAESGLAARRLDLLVRTGAGHLAADRALGTLSLGEARRIELVSWLALVRRGQTILLDEPGMGLHGRERLALAELLQELTRGGNTLLTADPAREFLEAAHGWVQLGPGGGPQGGRLVAQGNRASLEPASLPSLRAAAVGEPPAELRFTGLRARHLAIEEMRLPLGRVVAICGPSGCGKSTLLEEELLPRLRAGSGFSGTPPPGGVGVLLERALRFAPQSTVATLSGAWDEIRRVFADGEEARMRGLAPSDLVAQPGRGACATCCGSGLDAAGLACGSCFALGLREDLLDLRWRTRSLRDWLTTPLAELQGRLPSDRRLPLLVQHLAALGLGPRCFGERGRHLSLGERSRIALARALAAARSDAPRLFLLDEPCLGLPLPEAQRVTDLLHALAARGHGFWAVEHHELFLRQADHLVELGPGAGAAGGRLLYSGPPAGLAGLHTPTADWWRARARGGRAPVARKPSAPRSRALPGGFAGTGRAELEAALRCELSLRSPLESDAPEEAVEAVRTVSEPVAWPVDPDRRASAAELLGLATLLPALRRAGSLRCAACGGGGPWPDLAAACASRPAGELCFVAPLPQALLERPELAQWLQSAGFRSVLRAGRLLRATKAAALQPRDGDGLLLDRLDPQRDPEAANRLRDVDHHRRALGSERLVAFAPERLDQPAWEFRPEACRDCGARGVGSAVHLGGWNLETLQSSRIEETIALARRHAPDPAPWKRAADLLAGTSLLACAFGTPSAGLTELERRLARLAGWLLFPPHGATLLLDQPLAGLPQPLARRLAAALLDPPSGAAFWFTDAEGHAAPLPRSRASAPRIRPLPLDPAFDLESWCLPARARPEVRLREALGLSIRLRQHFLRTEHARALGLGEADLDGMRSAWRCEDCGGSGVVHLHPALVAPCRSCRGSGFEPQAGLVEDRGLRWTELGRQDLRTLVEHFRESPALARPLEAAVAAGLGGCPLDAPLHVLPLAVRTLAPLAAQAAGEEPPEGLRLGLAAAGLNVLEARAVASTIEGLASGAGVPEWREQHPALAEPS